MKEEIKSIQKELKNVFNIFSELTDEINSALEEVQKLKDVENKIEQREKVEQLLKQLKSKK